LVENYGVSEIGASWRVAQDPIYHLGWSPGDPQFENLRFGFLRPDGRAVVADAQSALIYLLSQTGEVSATLGGRGEGPGEFSRISGLVALEGDSFLVSDGGNARVTTFENTRVIAESREAVYAADANYDPIGRMPQERSLLIPTGFAVGALEDGETGWRSYPVFFSHDYEVLDTVAELEFMKILETGSWNPVRHFGLVAVTGGGIAHAKTDQAQVTWFGEDGSPDLIARWDAPTVPVSDEDWVDYELGARERTRPGGDPERLENQLRNRRRDFAGTKPLFRSIHGDLEGNVWLGDHQFSRLTSSTYFVLSAAGEWMGSVSFPRPIRILGISDDRVLGVELDDLGIQAVAVYEVEK
jgi:hypothetical protein